MFNRDGKLDIFEDFRVDRSLPKHKPTKTTLFELTTASNEMSMDDSINIGSINVVSGTRAGRFRAPRDPVGDNEGLMLWMEEGFLPWPWRWLRRVQRLWNWLRRKPAQGRTITIQQFFTSLKNSADELKIVEERAAGYEASMLKAKAAGQTALYENLEKGLQAVRAETQLVALGLVKYLDEETLVEFVKRAKKGLRLDWMANFARVVPDSVLATKQKADERQVFDNYVVLHYDPNKKSWAETKKEREARKDPILFGVIEGKRRLYFVGDWVDEYCDLTLDQIADTLGQEAVKGLT